MTPDFFNQQISRMHLRFGEKAFDPEFTKLVAREVSAMQNEDFMRLVDFMIGSRKHNMPPTLTDFRESRIAIEKRAFSREVGGAARAMDRQWQGGLHAYLAKEYPGAKTLNDAVAIQIEKNRIARAMGGE